MALTARREAFARHIADGKSQADAYRAVYSTKNCTLATIHNEASKLMRIPEVSARVDALKQAAAERVLWTREQSIRILAEIAQAAEKDADRVRAINELNKMHGFEAAQKVEHSGAMSLVSVLKELDERAKPR